MTNVSWSPPDRYRQSYLLKVLDLVGWDSTQANKKRRCWSNSLGIVHRSRAYVTHMDWSGLVSVTFWSHCPDQDSTPLYAFKSRGFGGEVGLDSFSLADLQPINRELPIV